MLSDKTDTSFYKFNFKKQKSRTYRRIGRPGKPKDRTEKPWEDFKVKGVVDCWPRICAILRKAL